MSVERNKIQSKEEHEDRAGNVNKILFAHKN